MALIRVMVGENDHRKWARENSTAPELMKHIFGTDGLPISVYSVNAGIEEAKAVAAHYLTLARQSFKSVSALRIEPQDLAGLEIAVRETPGDTGIAEVDAKHRELMGGPGRVLGSDSAPPRRYPSRRRPGAHSRGNSAQAPSTRVPDTQW
jgi:hypothetical protein